MDTSRRIIEQVCRVMLGVCIGYATSEAGVYAQTTQDKVYQMCEQPPMPAGGMSKFHEYTEDNIVRPSLAKQKGVRGNVFVQFIVEKDGRLSNIKIVRGLGNGCDEAVIDCLRKAPPWLPGKNEGRAVRVQKTLAIAVR